MKLRSSLVGIVGAGIVAVTGKLLYEGILAIYQNYATKLFDDSLSPYVVATLWPRVHPVVDWLNNFWGGVSVALSLAFVIERLWAWRFPQNQDQAIIADLRRQLDEPDRQRRIAFENGLQQARAEFAVEMRKYLYGYNPEFMIANFTDEVLEHLSNHAVLFTHDNDISDMWRIFVDAFKKQASILKIDLNMPDPEGFVEVQINRNLNYFYKIRREAAKEIIAYLTYEKKGPSDLYKTLSEIRNTYDGMGRVEFYDQASLNDALSSRIRQDTV